MLSISFLESFYDSFLSDIWKTPGYPEQNDFKSKMNETPKS